MNKEIKFISYNDIYELIPLPKDTDENPDRLELPNPRRLLKNARKPN